MTGAAMALFEQCAAALSSLSSPRAWAFALLGLDAYLRRFPGASDVRRARLELAERLYGQFCRNNADRTGHGRRTRSPTPTASFRMRSSFPAAALDRPEMVDAGIASLRWLMDIQTDAKGHFVPIGNRRLVRARRHAGPFRPAADRGPAHGRCPARGFIRSPATERWLDEARRCFEWFLGRNDLQQPIADHATGGCRDGLHRDGVNQNQGAESTLAWLHSLIALHIAMGTAEITVHDISAARSKTPIARLP